MKNNKISVIIYLNDSFGRNFYHNQNPLQKIMIRALRWKVSCNTMISAISFENIMLPKCGFFIQSMIVREFMNNRMIDMALSL